MIDVSTRTSGKCRLLSYKQKTLGFTIRREFGVRDTEPDPVRIPIRYTSKYFVREPAHWQYATLVWLDDVLRLNLAFCGKRTDVVRHLSFILNPHFGKEALEMLLGRAGILSD